MSSTILVNSLYYVCNIKQEPYNLKQKEYYKTYRQSVCDKLRINVNEYNWIRRKGEALHKVYEQNCNGDLQESLYNKLVEKYTKEVNVFADSLGLKTFFQSDPRGASIYLDFDNIPYNNYTKAYCIY